jgi:PEP-CTERM motif
MRKTLWIMLAVLLVAIAAPAVHADGVYAITFNGPGAPTVVGSDLLDYNSTLKEFTTPSLEIMFDGLTVTLDNQNFAGAFPTDRFSWGGPFVDGNFDISETLLGENIYSGALPSSAAFDDGSVTLTAQTVPAPEPSSVALMLLGVGLVFGMQKRNPRGHQLAS